MDTKSSPASQAVGWASLFHLILILSWEYFLDWRCLNKGETCTVKLVPKIISFVFIIYNSLKILLVIEDVSLYAEVENERWYPIVSGFFVLTICPGVSIILSMFVQWVHATFNLLPNADGLQKYGIIIFDGFVTLSEHHVVRLSYVKILVIKTASYILYGALPLVICSSYLFIPIIILFFQSVFFLCWHWYWPWFILIQILNW